MKVERSQLPPAQLEFVVVIHTHFILDADPNATEFRLRSPVSESSNDTAMCL
ncbi:MAG: hypothetical protein VX733_10135 [Candidatus Latescibacterota bacterium]|nr:hypothetical protein [Candidatus Latescibacterota bacterium]